MSNKKRLAETYITGGLFLPLLLPFPPAFLFSHRKWLRRAIFYDSFPPGEAKGAAAPEVLPKEIATALKALAMTG